VVSKVRAAVREGTSFLEDDTDMEEIELEKAELKGQEAQCLLGPIGTGPDGLGESGIFSTHRRKSADTSMDSPPSSPLKTCNFGFGDTEIGRSKRELEMDEDAQMEEALRARSEFLRRCERGDEEFGDEVPVFSFWEGRALGFREAVGMAYLLGVRSVINLVKVVI